MENYMSYYVLCFKFYAIITGLLLLFLLFDIFLINLFIALFHNLKYKWYNVILNSALIRSSTFFKRIMRNH